jgi:hypothetical protein
MHPTRSTSILISLAAVAACVVPVIAGQKPVAPQGKKPSAVTHGPTATPAPAKSGASTPKTAAATATTATTNAKAGGANAGPAKATDVKSSAPKTSTQPKATTASAAAKTSAPAAAKTTTAATKPAAAGAVKAADKKAAPAATASTATNTKKSAAPATPTWTPDNPVAEKLAGKPTIVAKAKSVLPADADLNSATSGFKNFGQFVAAVNVSKNLGIPFADLKANMTGLKLDGQPTGKASTSLGGAIRLLKGDADPMAEAQRATAEADAEIGESSTPPTRTASTTAAAKTPVSTTTPPATGAAKTTKKPVGQSASAAR